MDEFPLHRAAQNGDLERVRQLIKGGVAVVSRDVWGLTPLHWAAECGRYEVVDFLISSKCDLNIKDDEGDTPLILSAIRKQKDIVDLLLRHGAQVNCADREKWTLLHYASEYDWMDIVHHILDSREADLDAATMGGSTPLMQSAQREREDVAALLIRAGADVNRRDAEKATALHWAACYGRTRVVQVLLKVEGLEINPQDEDGRTPLHWACYGGHRAVVKQLLVAGADTTLKDNGGETALTELLWVSITQGEHYWEELNLADIRLLVQYGAFLQDCDYVYISKNPFLKNILKDVGVCTQSIVNKFHRQSLPALDSISYFARKLPNVNKFKLNPRQMDEVEKLVKGEIERKGFCNVVKAHPMALSALCVLSLITCQSGTKRSASPDFGDSNSPFKKLHT